MIFLDNASTTRPLDCAVLEFGRILRDAPYNPSSSHMGGQIARSELERAREKIASCINADADEIYFTSGSTESCNIAMNTLTTECSNIIISPYEHHAVHDNFDSAILTRKLLSRQNIPASFQNGIAQMLVCNETGEIFRVPNESENTLVFSDLTAAVGHTNINVKELGISYGAFGAHKFGGVRGAGVLYVKGGSPVCPLIQGGGQERGVRAGTENVPAICAMAVALEWHTARLEQSQAYFSMLRDTMLSELDDSGVSYIVNSPLDRSAPHILNVSFPCVENTALSLYLSSEGVYVSPGAACSNGLNEPSHVLMSMFGDEDRARSAIRFSFSHETNVKQICDAVEKVAESVRTLRGLSAE